MTSVFISKINSRLTLLVLFAFCLLIINQGCTEDNNEGVQTRFHYLAIAGDNTLTFLNLDDNELENHGVGVGTVANWIGLTQNNEIIVINSVSNDLGVISISTDGFQEEATHNLGIEEANNPYWGALDESSNNLYVTNLLTHSVSVFSLENNEIASSFPTGQSPAGVIADDNYLYVACTGYDPLIEPFGGYLVSYLYKHDKVTGEVVDKIEVETNGQFLAFDQNGMIHLVSTGDYFITFGVVQIIDPSTLEEQGRVEFPGISPGQIILAPNGTAYLAAGGWGEEGLIARYDIETLAQLETIIVPSGVMALSISPSGDRLFATCNNWASGEYYIAEVRSDTLYSSYQLAEPANALQTFLIDL